MVDAGGEGDLERVERGDDEAAEEGGDQRDEDDGGATGESITRAPACVVPTETVVSNRIQRTVGEFVLSLVDQP